MSVQDSVAEVFNSISKAPMLDTKLVTNVVVGTTATPIDHGLGRPLLGWIVVDRTINASVWRSPTASAAPNKLLMLVASSSVTISILVF